MGSYTKSLQSAETEVVSCSTPPSPPPPTPKPIMKKLTLAFPDRNVHSPNLYHGFLYWVVMRVWCYIKITYIFSFLNTCLTDISLKLWGGSDRVLRMITAFWVEASCVAIHLTAVDLVTFAWVIWRLARPLEAGPKLNKFVLATVKFGFFYR